MTAEQLEELRRLIARANDFAEQAKGHDAPLFEAELVKMADAMDGLMRRVLAAEKLVEAGSAMADAAEHGLVSSTIVTAWDCAETAYREASK